MKGMLRKMNYISVTLITVSILLAGVIMWEWNEGLRLEMDLLKIKKMLPSNVPASKILPEFQLPDAESGYPEMLSRPLFLVSRRPPAVENQGPTAMKKGQFVLTGVTILPTLRIGLLRDVTSNKTVRAEEGKEIRGMQVEKIGPGEVVLKLGDEREVLVLKVQTSKVVQAAAPIQSPPVESTPFAPVPPVGAPAAAPGPQDGSKTGALPGPLPVPVIPAAQPKRSDPIPPRSQWNLPN